MHLNETARVTHDSLNCPKPKHVTIDDLSKTTSAQYQKHFWIASILAQLILIGLVLHQLDLQSVAFQRVILLAVPGLLIHHLLPPRYRLPFFVLLSLASIFLTLVARPSFGHLWTFGLMIGRVAIIRALGALLIAICHLPIPLSGRIVLLLVAACGIAFNRARLIGWSSLALLWPVLAAAFMFRLIVYLYDLTNSFLRPRLVFSLAYFTMITNACCPLFPVIDFKTFCSTYQAYSCYLTSQRGADWMRRGLIQLIVYRFIDQLLFLPATAVRNGMDLIQFLLTSLLVYLKVSGLFHLIVGLLLLFGFNLPETNHRYLLASSFTDYWRRVNIYWKDFMMKVIFYPVFFKMKKWGTYQALIVAIMGVFIVTWGLHIYQAWWLTGSATISWPDILFWFFLGILVLLNAVWEMKHTRKPMAASARERIADTAWLTLRTAATFTCICLLWSLWNTPSVSLWVGLWRYADRNTLSWTIVVLTLVMIAKVFEILSDITKKNAASPSEVLPTSRKVLRISSQPLTLLVAIYVVILPAVQARLDDPRLQPVRDAIAAGDSLTYEIGEGRGYYAQLSNPGEANVELWQFYARHGAPDPYMGGEPWPIHWVKEYRQYAPLPSVRTRAYNTDYRTNRWGMRDQECQRTTPPSVIRLALLGSSQAMGWGIREEEVFEHIVEDRLNREFSPSAQVHFEILNFAMPRYSSFGQISALQNWVAPFRPDILLVVLHSIDYKWVGEDLHNLLRRNVPIHDEFVLETLRNARVVARTHPVLATGRLSPYAPSVLAWVYRRLVEEARVLRALPVAIEVPLPWEIGDRAAQERLVAQMDLARSAGFLLLDFSDVFNKQHLEDLTLPNAFNHLSPTAHSLIANRLYWRLTTDPRIDLLSRAHRRLFAAQSVTEPQLHISEASTHEISNKR